MEQRNESPLKIGHGEGQEGLQKEIILAQEGTAEAECPHWANILLSKSYPDLRGQPYRQAGQYFNLKATDLTFHTNFIHLMNTFKAAVCFILVQ